MTVQGPFSIPPAFTFGAQLARVVSVRDPKKLARVKLRLIGPDADNEATFWARVAVPFAGSNRGAFLIPNVNDEVLVVFAGGDPRAAVVLGGLWNGKQKPPEALGGAHVDRWSLTGTNGTRVALVEAASGQEEIVMETPNGVTARLTDQGGGKVELVSGANSVTLDATGVTVKAAAAVTVKAPQVQIQAPSVKVDAIRAEFTGVVRCMTLDTNAVRSKSYTLGLGNIW